jgi:hypothetical protein
MVTFRRILRPTGYLRVSLLDRFYFVEVSVLEWDLPLDDVAGFHLYPVRVSV